MPTFTFTQMQFLFEMNCTNRNCIYPKTSIQYIHNVQKVMNFTG
jgi:hypothetical protein